MGSEFGWFEVSVDIVSGSRFRFCPTAAEVEALLRGIESGTLMTVGVCFIPHIRRFLT